MVCYYEDIDVTVTIRSKSEQLPTIADLKLWESYIKDKDYLRFIVSIHIDKSRKMFLAQKKLIKNDGLSCFRCLWMLTNHVNTMSGYLEDLDFSVNDEKLKFIDWLGRIKDKIQKVNFPQLVIKLEKIIAVLLNETDFDDEWLCNKDLWLTTSDIPYVIGACSCNYTVANFDAIRGDYLELSTLGDGLASDGLNADDLLKALCSDSCLIMGCSGDHYFPFAQSYDIRSNINMAMMHPQIVQDDAGNMSEILDGLPDLEDCGYRSGCSLPSEEDVEKEKISYTERLVKAVFEDIPIRHLFDLLYDANKAMHCVENK